MVGILWSFLVIGHSQYQGWGPMFVDHRHTHSDYSSTKVLPGNVNKSTSMYFHVLSVFIVKTDLLVMEMFEVYVLLWKKMIQC